MPIKSQAQRRKFAELLVDGKISNEVYERWNRGAGYKDLPEHVKPKAKKTTKKRAAKAKPKKKAASRSTRKTTKRATSTRKGKKRSSA